jgi:GMP synthase (glutamine-hydrolysing)
MATTIALLDASVGDTPAERNFRRELDADLDVYKLPEGRFPPAVSSSNWRYDGVVISGSQTSVYDDHDWIHEATEWFRRAHAADVPTLGVCWGHQFVAQALGGRVVDTGGHVLGYREVERAGEDPLFAGVPGRFTAFETHSDRVAELPRRAATLARNDAGVQAFRVGSAWGVQFHPEYDRETAEWVIRGKDLSGDRTRRLLDSVADAGPSVGEDAARVFENFREVAATHQPVTRRTGPS